MTFEKVETEDMSFEPVEADTTGTILITSPPYEKVKAEGKKVYFGDTSATVSGAVYAPGGVPACTQSGPPVPVSIKVSSNKTSSHSGYVLRENDTSIQVLLPGLNPSSAACTIPFTVKVTDTGQEKVKSQ